MTAAARQDRDAWIERARSADILDTAQRLGAELKRSGSEHIGPCPVGCSTTDGFSVNTRKRVFYCRKGGASGDVIALVQHVRGGDFNEAVAWLNNEDAPAPALRPRVDHEAAEQKYRAKEIDTARGIWRAGVPIEGTPAEAYLGARGINHLPPGYELRFIASQSYWHVRKGEKESSVIHRGPVLLGRLTDETGEIVGVHITWLDADGGKARIPDPDDEAPRSSSPKGDSAPQGFLDAKKIRGSKRRAAERIQDLKGGGKRLVIGEGRETVLSVWLAERATMKASWSYYWSAIDLGHLAGKAQGTIKHPELKHASGRPVMVQGPTPADDDKTILIPDEVTVIVLLGDGDSDRFTTELALRRAAARWDRQGRVIKVAWGPAGMDFNDILRRAPA